MPATSTAITNDLQAHLQANKHLQNVYFNEKGQWQFHERPGYDQKLTRDQVLKMDVSDQKIEGQKVALSTTAGTLTDDAMKKGKDVEPEDKKDMTTKEDDVVNPKADINIDVDKDQAKQSGEVQESFVKPEKKK